MVDENLIILRMKADDAKAAYAYTGMANVYGVSVEKRIAIDLRHRAAERAWLDAEAAYERALEAEEAKGTTAP